MGGLAIARLSVIETMRRKEFYVILVLVVGLAVWLQTLDLQSSTTGRFAKDIVMQVTWLASFALASALASRAINSDVEQKTVYVLASRSIHRWHYVMGRALGAGFASITCFTGLYLVLVLMLLVKGAGGAADPSLWQAYVLQVVALFLLCSIAVFFSTFSTASGAVTFTLIILVVMRYGGQSILNHIESGMTVGFLRELAWIGYLAMPHFEFFSISQRVVHGWGMLPVPLFLQIIAYGVAYSLALIACASLVFQRRWL